MIMNFIVDVADMLNVEMGESFKIIDEKSKSVGIYYFTERGLFEKGFGINRHALAMLLEGNYIICKLPWKPMDGETYYFPDIFTGIPDANKDEWCNDDKYDKMRYETGMVCKTANEAIEKAEKMLAVLGRTK